MKKILGISLVAMLAVSPMMAMAAAVPGDPGATVEENAPIAEYEPKYGLAEAADSDGAMATAGYVKGAYNASIKAINAVDARIDDLSTDYAEKDFSNVADGTVAERLINTGAVTETKIGTGAVTETKIGTGAVTESKIDTGAVTFGKINSAAVVDSNTGIATSNASDSKLVTEAAVRSALNTMNTAGATKQGVVSTINHSTATVSGTFNAVTTWGVDSATPVTVNSSGTVSAPGTNHNEYYETYDDNAGAQQTYGIHVE